MKTFAKSISFLLIMLLAVACSKDEALLSLGDELSDALKGAPVIDEEIYFSGKMLFNVVAPKENNVILDPENVWLFLYAKLTPDPTRVGYYKLLTREWMPSQGPDGTPIYNDEGEQFPMFELRVVEFDAKVTPGGAVKFYWPGLDKWWEIGGIPYANVVEQVISHTGVEINGPGVNKGTIMFDGYFMGDKFYTNCHLSGMQLYVPAMDMYWNGFNPEEPDFDLPPFIEGPVKINFTMEMTVCEECEGSPWDDPLPFE